MDPAQWLTQLTTKEELLAFDCRDDQTLRDSTVVDPVVATVAGRIRRGLLSFEKCDSKREFQALARDNRELVRVAFASLAACLHPNELQAKMLDILQNMAADESTLVQQAVAKSLGEWKDRETRLEALSILMTMRRKSPSSPNVEQTLAIRAIDEALYHLSGLP